MACVRQASAPIEISSARVQSCWLHGTPRHAGRPAPRVARGPDTGRDGTGARPTVPRGLRPCRLVRRAAHTHLLAHGPRSASPAITAQVTCAQRQHVVVKLNAARPVVLVRVRAGRQVCTRHGGADVCLLLAYHACAGVPEPDPRRLRVEGPNKLGRHTPVHGPAAVQCF